MKSKNAQIWGFDMMVALTLFLIGVMVFFSYSINKPEETRESFELLFYDGEIIADNLMSEGYPNNWDSNTAVILGLTTGNKINESKLTNLYDMIYAENNYSKTKRLFSTTYDYYFFFDDNMTINAAQVEGIGKPGVNKNNITSRNLVKISRFTIYQNKTVPLYLYVWQE